MSVCGQLMLAAWNMSMVVLGSLGFQRVTKAAAVFDIKEMNELICRYLTDKELLRIRVTNKAFLQSFKSLNRTVWLNTSDGAGKDEYMRFISREFSRLKEVGLCLVVHFNSPPSIVDTREASIPQQHSEDISLFSRRMYMNMAPVTTLLVLSNEIAIEFFLTSYCRFTSPHLGMVIDAKSCTKVVSLDKKTLAALGTWLSKKNMELKFNLDFIEILQKQDLSSFTMVIERMKTNTHTIPLYLTSLPFSSTLSANDPTNDKTYLLCRVSVDGACFQAVYLMSSTANGFIISRSDLLFLAKDRGCLRTLCDSC